MAADPNSCDKSLLLVLSDTLFLIPATRGLTPGLKIKYIHKYELNHLSELYWRCQMAVDQPGCHRVNADCAQPARYGWRCRTWGRHIDHKSAKYRWGSLCQTAWSSSASCPIFYGLDWTVHLVGGEVNLVVWGGCMETTDEDSGHEIYGSISSVKMGPSGGEQATWNQLMWPKQSRLSDWAPLFIWGLIASLSTSRRCAVCAQIIALCEAKLAARERQQLS